MNKKVQLFFLDISEIVGSDGFSVVRLSDYDRQRLICFICDRTMTDQIALRIKHVPEVNRMLPEVLSKLLLGHAENHWEMLIYEVFEGQYRVVLYNRLSNVIEHLRMSDAVLLHYISKIPLYIEENLMMRQSTPYNPQTTGISIPINALDTERLNHELERAIEAEDYMLASHLHEELKRRIKL